MIPGGRNTNKVPRMPLTPVSPPLFHVIDPRVFDRAQLDDLCDLTNRVRLLAKHPDGARFLLGLLPDRRAMLLSGQIRRFAPPSTWLGGKSCRHRTAASTSGST